METVLFLICVLALAMSHMRADRRIGDLERKVELLLAQDVFMDVPPGWENRV